MTSSSSKCVTTMRSYEVRISHADLYRRTTSKTFLQIHPQARHMVSHNRRWDYVFHIEGELVIVDRIIPAKMNKG